MADALYPSFKQKLLEGDANAALNSAEGATGLFAALIDTADEAYNPADVFYSDITPAAIVGTDQEILSKTVVGGLLDGSNLTFPSVLGDGTEAVILYRKNAGANTTWVLVAFLDSGLAVTPNGTDIIITWDAAGIFQL